MRSHTLDDIAKIRKRPGMYAGDLSDGTALHNLVLGVVSFAVAQIRSLPSFNTKVILRADFAITVCAAGSEAWSDDELRRRASTRLKAATSIVDCIRLDQKNFATEGGAACDLCVANALSEWLCDQYWSGTSTYASTFKDGVFQNSVQSPLFPEVMASGQRGMSTTFLPSDNIFPSIVFDAGKLLGSLALIRHNLGVRVTFVDER